MEHGKDKRPDQNGEGVKAAESASLEALASEIGLVLALATVPALPEGAEARLMARIAAEPQDAQIRVLAPRPQARRPALRFAAALPLAASLALGVYLGAQGTLDFMLPSAITGGVAWNEDGQIDDLGGVGDADAYAQAQDSTT